ncbi:signal recognition particle subunit SRP72 [Sporobolomyces salmoneus]|uniref:signal recognition particle subunit SRP72 n=1 Tax=Sporobolomyces salmoneus TaxID=183962 RepID=UPI00316FE643
MSSTQKLYRTLHDQLDQSLYAAALRTVSKILRVEPEDALALSTRLQLLLALERYPEALKSADQPIQPVERAYALYKSARAKEAKEVLEQDEEVDLEQDRGAKVLLAQVDYRLGNYEESRDVFDDLANTADTDSPELDDLQHNSEQCSSHLSFLSSVPSLSSDQLNIEDLESRPLSLVLPSQPRTLRLPVASTSNVKPVPEENPSMPKSRSKTRPLKRFDPNRVPAEDRWIPKRQRPSMRDQLLQNKEKMRGKKRDKVQALTQGSSAVEEPPSTPGKGTNTPSKASGYKGGGGGGKKKKGKK